MPAAWWSADGGKQLRRGKANKEGCRGQIPGSFSLAVRTLCSGSGREQGVAGPAWSRDSKGSGDLNLGRLMASSLLHYHSSLVGASGQIHQHRLWSLWKWPGLSFWTPGTGALGTQPVSFTGWEGAERRPFNLETSWGVFLASRGILSGKGGFSRERT